jgi:hypothetical protein
MEVDSFVLQSLLSSSSSPPPVIMKKKVGRRGSKQSICLVCGDTARIINYGALCCQACKTFFRRNASNTSVCILLLLKLIDLIHISLGSIDMSL